MKRDINKISKKLLELIEPLLVTGEDVCGSFRESFNWDLTSTWIVLTTFRLVIIRSLPGNTDVEDFHLKDMNLELKRDNVGLYDTLQFKSRETNLFEIVVHRKRRAEAQKFIHDVSENIRSQVTFGLQPVKKREPVADIPVNKKLVAWCTRKLQNLRQMGAITEEELQEEKTNNPECRDDL